MGWIFSNHSKKNTQLRENMKSLHRSYLCWKHSHDDVVMQQQKSQKSCHWLTFFMFTFLSHMTEVCWKPPLVTVDLTFLFFNSCIFTFSNKEKRYLPCTNTTLPAQYCEESEEEPLKILLPMAIVLAVYGGS